MPDRAGRYFSKIQCFCFTEQRLDAGQSVEMPVSFFIAPEILTDRDGDNIQRDHPLLHVLPAANQKAVEKTTPPADRLKGAETRKATTSWHTAKFITIIIWSIPARGRSSASIGAFIMLIGAVFWMNEGYTGFWGLPVNGQPWIFILGFVLVLYTMAGWWRDVVRESVVKGDHKPVVKLGLRYGMILFIASEVMFFFAWFFAYFNAALFPIDVGIGQWPPEGIVTFDPWHLPLINTHDPADLGQHGHLGASRDPDGRPQGRDPRVCC